MRAIVAFDVMVNYWWAEPHALSSMGALSHAVLAIRDLAPAQRLAWRRWFEHYVFDDAAPDAANHLPAHAMGVLSPPSELRNARFTAQIADALSPPPMPAARKPG